MVITGAMSSIRIRNSPADKSGCQRKVVLGKLRSTTLSSNPPSEGSQRWRCWCWCWCILAPKPSPSILPTRSTHDPHTDSHPPVKVGQGCSGEIGSGQRCQCSECCITAEQRAKLSSFIQCGGWSSAFSTALSSKNKLLTARNYYHIRTTIWSLLFGFALKCQWVPLDNWFPYQLNRFLPFLLDTCFGNFLNHLSNSLWLQVKKNGWQLSVTKAPNIKWRIWWHMRQTSQFFWEGIEH